MFLLRKAKAVILFINIYKIYFNQPVYVVIKMKLFFVFNDCHGLINCILLFFLDLQGILSLILEPLLLCVHLLVRFL